VPLRSASDTDGALVDEGAEQPVRRVRAVRAIAAPACAGRASIVPPGAG
jgi:hypothetical protein